MALKSMTGFGKGEAASRTLKVEVELSSVNRKQFDMRINLPRDLAVLEARIQKLINQSIYRGYVTGNVRVSSFKESRKKKISIDMETGKALVGMLERMGKDLGIEHDVTTRALVSVPEIVCFSGVQMDPDKVWPVLRKALREALTKLIKMREDEGSHLSVDLIKRLEKARKSMAAIKKKAPFVVKKYRAAILRRVEKAGVKMNKKDPLLLKEIAVFADKSDISEEIVRLESHFKQVSGLLRGSQKVGRTLDFLCQEIFREINTIGSKANDLSITKSVIALKADFESIREQIQNLE